MNLFRDYTFERQPVLREGSVNGTCHLLALDRQRDTSDQDLLRQAIEFFHGLGTYTHLLEPRLLELFQTFVMAWASTSIASVGLSEYVNGCVALMAGENERAELLQLDASTRREIAALARQHLVDRQVEFLGEYED